MKILSIDVGMKNLAYCLLNVSETNNYDIIDWNVVNLTDSDKYICKCLKKNNKVCGKKAKYFKNANYYCKTHAKQSNYNIPTNELNINSTSQVHPPNTTEINNKYNVHCT